MDFLGFLWDVVNFALCPDALRPALVATFGCESKRGALMGVSRQERMVLSDSEWATLASWVFVQERFGGALRRISRRRRPLHTSPLTAASLHELWRISRARKMGGVRANTPNADRIDSLTASRRAA